MHGKKENTRALFGIIAASVLVVAAIALLSIFSGDLRHGGIVLPEGEQTAKPQEETSSGEGFVTLTTENVPDVVRTLKRPSCYHQTLSEIVPAGERPTETTVDLWVRGDIWKIIRRDPSGTRCILTDGKKAYLWYTDDARAMNSLILPSGVTRDELAGVVTYETVASAAPGTVLEAAYQPLPEDADHYCLFVRMQDGATYRIDLDTGLLLGAELQRNGKSTYTLRQTSLELLPADNAALAKELTIPVGTADFSAEAETRQG